MKGLITNAVQGAQSTLIKAAQKFSGGVEVTDVAEVPQERDSALVKSSDFAREYVEQQEEQWSVISSNNSTIIKRMSDLDKSLEKNVAERRAAYMQSKEYEHARRQMPALRSALADLKKQMASVCIGVADVEAQVVEKEMEAETRAHEAWVALHEENKDVVEQWMEEWKEEAKRKEAAILARRQQHEQERQQRKLEKMVQHDLER